MRKAYQNKLRDKRLDNLEDAVRDIKDNHLVHMLRKITKTSTDVDWLKRFFWIVIAASVGGLVGTVINLLVTITSGRVV